MEYTLEQKYELISQDALMFDSKDPIDIVKGLMHREYVNIHGPEHHFLDGVAFLVAYKNAGGKLDIADAVKKLKERTVKMPGAMCGLWGICGSVAAVGAALSIIHETGPLSDDRFYKDHMEYTSSVLHDMSVVGGPRCCKRNAFLSLTRASEFVKDKYGVEMVCGNTDCEFSDRNVQCIKERCPFYKKRA